MVFSPHRRIWSRARLRVVALATAAALTPVTFSAASAAAAAVHQQQIWQAHPAQHTASVPGANATTRRGATPAAAAAAAHPYQAPAVKWPAAGAATVALARAAAVPAKTRVRGDAAAVAPTGIAPGKSVKAGALPVTLASLDDSATAAAAAKVTLASRAQAHAAGINGVILSVFRTDAAATTSQTAVTLDYTAFAAAYGGGWQDRLTVVELPACALTTPKSAACRTETPVRFTQDYAAQTLTAQVSLGGAAASGARPSKAKVAAVGAGMVFAATSTASGSVGSYSATSLSPDGTWAAGGNSGDFTYSYPVTVPPTVGGTAPDVALSYDSGSVDARTSATSAQASWIGDGWDYSPGYIERSYQSCSQDGIANSGDECWAGNELTLSLGGQSDTLVRDDSTGTWKSQSDDGTEVLPVTGSDNGAYDGESWEVVTPGGTRYYFGLDYLPGTTSTGTSTNSVWTEPVYCPKAGDGPSGDSCYSSSSGSNSVATNMAYRWNLAYAVDPHGNLITYDWATETNYYSMGAGQASGGTGTSTQYVRGGYLSSISYGYLLSGAVAGTAKPEDQVDFGVSERCLNSASFDDCTYAALTAAVTADNSSSVATEEQWYDTPSDLICPTQSFTCANQSPAFFSTKRLTSITTQVLVGSTYQNADTYTLGQMFPAPQPGLVNTLSGVSASNPGDGTVAVMWLSSIQRTGDDTLGGGSSTADPAVSFTAEMMPNRVAGDLPNGTDPPAMYRPRMDYLDTESGSQVVVAYQQPQCSRLSGGAMPSSADGNTMACFPNYWDSTPDTPEEDWFNKYPVTSVTVDDTVAPAAWSQAQVTSYAYSGIAWHRDDSPLTLSNERTWDGYRGYRTVTTTTGVAEVGSVQTQTQTTYMQGMNGDYLASGSQRAVCVNDSVGDCVTDADWLQGQTLETDTLDGVGGTVEHKTVNGPWGFRQTASQAQADSMPPLLAEMASSTQSRSYQLWHDGSWKTLTTDTAYDTSGRVTTSDAKGDGTSAVPEVCTTTSYATSASSNPNMLAYPDEVVAVQGPCGTTATAADTVSDTRTFYDGSTTLGALTGAGNATRSQAVDSYNSSGVPQYVVESQATYDAYGRVLTATDADGNVTKTAYTAPGASPDVVTTTNPMGWPSTETLDPARDVATASTDANGELTTETYDGLGRLTAVWTPLHSQSSGGPAMYEYAYAPGGTTAPTTTTSMTLREDGSYASTVDIYDGELRQIQTQAPTADGSTGRLVTDTHYNSVGQVDKNTSAYSNTDSGPSTTLFQPANDTVVPQETETVYDGMGRATDAMTLAYGVTQWSTLTQYEGVDETDVTPPTGGTATSTFVDALGRQDATWSFSTATPDGSATSPTGNAANATVTSYTYTPAGNAATIADAVGDTWSYTYDLHGREVKLQDPGAGASLDTYDPDGNVLTSTDARGDTLSYAYDALGRKTAEYDTTGGATAGAADELASWTYDTLEKGQPTSSNSYTGGSANAAGTYTESVTGYNSLYQPTGSSVTIPSAEGALAGTYRDLTSYTSETSLLAGTHYYAEGGLPAEQVNYSYSLSGALLAYGGTNTYLNTASYTPFGQVTETDFGVYGQQLNQYELYDTATQRLLSASDDLQTQTSSPIQDTDYTYNQAGSITADSTTQTGVATADTQCFNYDGQNRLTQAYTDTAPVTTTTGSSTAQVQGIGQCGDTAPTAGKVTGGPAAYWQTYSYDALGDRVQQVNHDTSVSSTANNVTQALTYPSYNAATGATSAAPTPDAVQSVATTTATGTTSTPYGYDAGGNVTSYGGDKITYTPDGLTSQVQTTSGSTLASYTYDADGGLLVQHDPADAQAILYLPFGEQLTLNTTSGTVSGQRYYSSSPDGVTVVRDSNGSVYYELADKLGTATATVNASTLAFAFRYFDPFGNAIGTAAASWPDQHSYLGRPQDPATGLDLLGARQYNAATGRFMSVDPLLESGDQRQMNGYSYSGDDPVNGSDPNGTMAMSASGCVGSVQACGQQEQRQQQAQQKAAKQAEDAAENADLNACHGMTRCILGQVSAWHDSSYALSATQRYDNFFNAVSQREAADQQAEAAAAAAAAANSCSGFFGCVWNAVVHKAENYGSQLVNGFDSLDNFANLIDGVGGLLTGSFVGMLCKVCAAVGMGMQAAAIGLYALSGQYGAAREAAAGLALSVAGSLIGGALGEMREPLKIGDSVIAASSRAIKASTMVGQQVATAGGFAAGKDICGWSFGCGSESNTSTPTLFGYKLVS